jgi:hypothetical protein
MAAAFALGLVVVAVVSVVEFEVTRHARVRGNAVFDSGNTESLDAPSRRAQILRLQAHFDSVDCELRAAPNSWTRTQRTTRAELIEWLRAYRDAGSFPRNDLFPDRSVPYFRDGRGTLCAMAYLIDRSGRGDLVDRIARTRNNAFIRELADDASLVQWLEGVGLTVAEAARIQPTYGGDFGERYEERVSSRYAFQSLAASGLALATVGANIAAPNTHGKQARPCPWKSYGEVRGL